MSAETPRSVNVTGKKQLQWREAPRRAPGRRPDRPPLRSARLMPCGVAAAAGEAWPQVGRGVESRNGPSASSRRSPDEVGRCTTNLTAVPSGTVHLRPLVADAAPEQQLRAGPDERGGAAGGIGARASSSHRSSPIRYSRTRADCPAAAKIRSGPPAARAAPAGLRAPPSAARSSRTGATPPRRVAARCSRPGEDLRSSPAPPVPVPLPVALPPPVPVPVALAPAVPVPLPLAPSPAATAPRTKGSPVVAEGRAWLPGAGTGTGAGGGGPPTASLHRSVAGRRPPGGRGARPAGGRRSPW